MLRVPPGRLLVQSVDHFRAFLDDPFVFGQVAAAHALSDLHAMGARPWTALAIAAVPYGPGAKMRADLSAMLLGATQVLREDGCALVGGHSGEADEAALGFAVTGLAEPEALTRKSGLLPGDALILTKPLGTGIVLAGHMRGLTRASWLAAAIASMRRSNAAAARVLREHGVTACTDVTGFGLAGHLAEMTRASGVAATIWRDDVPGTARGAGTGGPGGGEFAGGENARAVANLSTEPRERVLIDPQTSGGLLGGVLGSGAGMFTGVARGGDDGGDRWSGGGDADRRADDPDRGTGLAPGRIARAGTDTVDQLGVCGVMRQCPRGSTEIVPVLPGFTGSGNCMVGRPLTSSPSTSIDVAPAS